MVGQIPPGSKDSRPQRCHHRAPICQLCLLLNEWGEEEEELTKEEQVPIMLSSFLFQDPLGMGGEVTGSFSQRSWNV